MRNIKTIFILVLSLILFAVSCSNEDKTGGETGINNNPPENDTEITDGETENTETTETIEAKDFPTDLLGTYRNDTVYSKYNKNGDTKVSYDETTKRNKIEGTWLKDGTTDGQGQGCSIEKWKQTKKGGNPIKLEGEYVKGEEKYTIIYDYASETLIGTCVHPDVTALFNGKQISKQP